MADYTNPSAPTKDNPIGLEIPIQSIQTDLFGLFWIECSYGRVWMIPEKKTGNPVPKVYLGSRGYKEVLPNDNFRGQSFISLDGEENIIEFSHNANSQKKEVNLAIVIWVNLEKIDKSRNEIFIEELKQEVEKKLSFNPHVKSLNNIIDENARDIFKGYDIDVCERELLMYPYGGMRFEITIAYETTCL